LVVRVGLFRHVMRRFQISDSRLKIESSAVFNRQSVIYNKDVELSL